MPPTPTPTPTHTPAPWSIDAGNFIISGGKDIARALGDCTTEEEDTANAARIVACVNACAGLNDPAADIATMRRALDDARKWFRHIASTAPHPAARAAENALSLLGDDAP